MKKYGLFFLFICLLPITCQGNAKVYQLSRSDCLRLIVTHTPRGDVAYQAGVDVQGKAVVPADVSGGIKIDPPQEMSIPIRLDLTKYYGVKPQATTKNHKALAANNTTLSGIDATLSADAGTIAGNQDSIKTTSQMLGEKLKNPVQDASELNMLFTDNVEKIKTSLDLLNAVPTLLSQSTEVVSENTKILEQQFNPYEKDAVVNEKNKIFRESTQAFVEGNQTHAETSGDQLNTLSAALQKDIDTLASVPRALPIQEQEALEGRHRELQAQIAAAQETYAALEQDPTLALLGEELAKLDDFKSIYAEQVDLGQVKIKSDGKIYFNNQPLFNEDEARIRKACKKILSKNP